MRTATKHSLLIQITSTYGHAIHLCSWDCPIRCALFRIDNHLASLFLNASMRDLIGQIVYMYLVRTNARICSNHQPGPVRKMDGGAFPRCRPADRRGRIARDVGQQPSRRLDHNQGEYHAPRAFSLCTLHSVGNSDQNIRIRSTFLFI